MATPDVPWDMATPDVQYGASEQNVGVDGVRDVTHWPDNAQAFYPHSGVSSKFHEHGEIALPEDYQAFFDK